MTSLEYTDNSSVVHRAEYSYSGDGFLAEIRKYENSALVDTVRIVRDGFLAIQDRDGSNNVVREYAWGLNLGGGIGGLLNLKQGGQDYAYLYDGKGNVAAVLDASQAVVAAYRYAPFGKLLAKTGSLDQPFGFSTKRYDAQTGLIHYQYRPYASEIGRWLTRDPLGEAGGMNLYAFVGNNPVNWVDPWGLLQRNPDGSYKAYPTGPIQSHSIEGHSFTFQPVNLVADDGTRIPAANFIAGHERTRHECFGYAFTGGQYKLRSEGVALLLQHENISNVTKRRKKVGDIVIYYENGEIKHAAKVSDTMLLGYLYWASDIAGFETMEESIKKGPIEVKAAWPSATKIEFWRYK